MGRSFPSMIPRGCICLPWVADQSLIFPEPLGLSALLRTPGWWPLTIHPFSSHISRVVSWETVLTHNALCWGGEVGEVPETGAESRLCHGPPGDSAHVPSQPGLRALARPWGLSRGFAQTMRRRLNPQSPDHQGTGGESTQPCIRPERSTQARAESAPLRWPRGPGVHHTGPPPTMSSLIVGV